MPRIRRDFQRISTGKKPKPMKEVTIDTLNWHEYVQVSLITQMKDGCVFKTRPVGYAHKDRPMKNGEQYSPLSTSFLTTPGRVIKLLE